MGCEDIPEAPKGTIDAQKMAAILTDVHLMESRISNLGNISLDSTTVVSEYLKGQILKKYGVDSASYYKSYHFYATNPELMEGIYDKVLKNLTTKKQKKDYTGL